MALRFNCLLLDTDIIKDIKDFMDALSIDMIAERGKAPFNSIYNQLIKYGIEIDVESAAALYRAQFDLSQNYYTSEDKLEKISGSIFGRILNTINKLEDRVIDSKTGERSPARDAADKIARMFRNTLIETTKVTSQMKRMQDALEKAVFTTIKKKKPTVEKKEFGELLGELLDETGLGIPNLSGDLNTMQDLVNEWRKEMAEYREGITDDTTQGQWDAYVEQAIAAVYDVFLSNSQARQIIDEALFKKGFGKTQEDGRIVKDWKKLAGGIKSAEELKANVESALADEVGPNNAELISNSLERQYKEFRQRQIEHNTKELTRRNKFKKSHTQTELQRLLTLYDYGLLDPSFGNEYKRLTARVVGVPVEEIAALGELQDLLSDFSAITKNYDQINLVEQVIDKAVSSILRNYQERAFSFFKNSDTFNISLLRIANNFRSFIRSGSKAILYSGPNALTQNPIGNAISVVVNTLRDRVTGQTRLTDNNIAEVARAIFQDVSKGGVTYGNTPNAFQLGDDWAEKLFSTDLVERNQALQIGVSALFGNWALDAADSASKYLLVQRSLINNIRQIIVDRRRPANAAQRKQFIREANAQISEALYGESFDQAKEKARDIIDNSNGHLRETEAFVTRLADDIVKANLINDGLLSAEDYASAFEASYEVAGRAIGHEGVPGAITKAVSNLFHEKEKQALKEGKTNLAAIWILGDTIMNNMILRFMGGAANWAVIGLKRTGLGMATAFIGGKPSIDVSEVTEEDLKKELIARDKFRQDFATGLIGAISTMIVFLLLENDWDGDGETFSDWVGKNKWAKKYVYAVLPIAYAGYIYAKEDKMGKFWARFFMVDQDFSVLSQLNDAFKKEGYKGRPLSNAERDGLVGQIVGKNVTQLPFGVWRVVRDGRDVYKGAVLGQEKQYQEDPTSFIEGMLWGDALYEFGGIDYLKKIGVIPPKDFTGVSGVGESTETALNNIKGFKGLDRQGKLDFLEKELKKQLLEHYNDMDLEEEKDFRKSQDIDIIFPELKGLSDGEKHRRLLVMQQKQGDHKLLKPNPKDPTEQVNIFNSDDLIQALLDIKE